MLIESRIDGKNCVVRTILESNDQIVKYVEYEGRYAEIKRLTKNRDT